MRSAARRAFAAILAALALAGCSTATFTRLAYNNAALAYSNLGPMLTWMVDDYVDLGGSREDWVRGRIDRLLAWHRAEELPRLRGLLETMLAKSARPFRVDDIAAHQRELRAAYYRVVARAMPDTAEFIAELGAADAEQMERRFADSNKRILRESVRGTPQERLERRIKRFDNHLENWVGPLTPAQRDLVARRYAELPDLTEEVLGERRYRQTELLALVRAKPPRAELEAGLRRIFVETDSWRRPEYAARLRERDARLHALVAELSATLSDGQRARLQERIRRFLGDISALTAAA